MTDTNPPELYWSPTHGLVTYAADKWEPDGGVWWRISDHRVSLRRDGHPNALPGDAVRLTPQTACTCATTYATYEGPEADCPVHGAVRALAEAQEELAENEGVLRVLRRQRDEALLDAERQRAHLDAQTRLAAGLAEERNEAWRKLYAAEAELARLREHATQLPEDWRHQVWDVIKDEMLAYDSIHAVNRLVESWRTATHPTPTFGAQLMEQGRAANEAQVDQPNPPAKWEKRDESCVACSGTLANHESTCGALRQLRLADLSYESARDGTDDESNHFITRPAPSDLQASPTLGASARPAPETSEPRKETDHA